MNEGIDIAQKRACASEGQLDARTHERVGRSHLTGGCLLAVIALVACSPRVPTRLDEPIIRAFVDAGARASVQRDAATLCGQLAEDAQVRLVEVRLSGSDTKNFDKAQWCELVKQGYATLPADTAISTNVNLRSIDIATDGKSAELGMEVIEEVGIGGQSMRMSTQQNGTVVLLAGQIKYTKLSARTAAGQ